MSKSIVIFDLDNGIADTSHRMHFLTTGHKKDWDSFYRACVDDTIREAARMLAGLLQLNGYEIVILTGRPEFVYNQTVEWLHKHKFPYDKLQMRPQGNQKPDERLKEKWMFELLGGPDKVLCAFESRDKVCEMYRGHNITCFQIADGKF